MRRLPKHDRRNHGRGNPGCRRDHGRLRHFDYVKPLRRKTRRSIGRRDPGSRGAPKQVGDHGCFVQRIDGMPRRGPPMRKGGHFITDKRHFAGVKAARTRLINETLRRIKEARRTHFPSAAYAMNETYEGMFLDDVCGILEDVL